MHANEMSALALRAAGGFGFITATIQQTVIKKVQETDPTRGGGCLVIADGETGVPIFLSLLGEPSPEKVGKYVEFAQEKALRLAGHPDHIASWQSRNEAAKQYGGAIRTRVGNNRNTIVSFSGLPEQWDEVLSYRVVQMLDLLGSDFDYLGDLREATGNPHLLVAD